ncbi:MAG: hypothetical protein ACTSP9_06505 [Promethearchaeota archaeon]
MKTYNGTGGNCNGSSGDSNRVLTLLNTKKTIQDGMLVYVSGLALALNIEYTVSHKVTGTEITFLNGLWDDMTIVVSYDETGGGNLTDNSSLFSASYDALEDFLKNNISDPKNRHKVNWIHASFPNINAMSFEGYPFITLKVNLNETNPAFDRTKSQKNFRAIITIYSDQPTEIETICDKIGELFRDENKLTDFDARDLSSSPISWTLDQKGKKVLFREINLDLRVRI